MMAEFGGWNPTLWALQIGLNGVLRPQNPLTNRIEWKLGRVDFVFTGGKATLFCINPKKFEAEEVSRNRI